MLKNFPLLLKTGKKKKKHILLQVLQTIYLILACSFHQRQDINFVKANNRDRIKKVLVAFTCMEPLI